MSDQMRMEERFFVARLDGLDFKPLPDAEFEVQILNSVGEGEVCAYIGRESNEVLALIHATKGKLPVEGHGIPEVVLYVARQQPIGHGEYVNAKGEIARPSFLPPWSYDENQR